MPTWQVQNPSHRLSHATVYKCTISWHVLGRERDNLPPIFTGNQQYLDGWMDEKMNEWIDTDT